MNCPTPPPCDVQHLEPIATIILVCVFGVLGEAAIAIAFVGWNALQTFRAQRLDSLHRREP